MKKVFNHELIEIKIPANSTSTKFQIPDQQNLRNCLVTGVGAYYEEVCPISILSGLPLITQAQTKSVFLTLQDYTGYEFIKQLPMVAIETIQGAGATLLNDQDQKIIEPALVNYPKSYISLSAPITLVNDVVVVFAVYYIDQSHKRLTTFGNKN